MNFNFHKVSKKENHHVFNINGVRCERYNDGTVKIKNVDAKIKVHPKFSDRILALNLLRSSNLGEMEQIFVLSITDRCNIKCDFCCHPYMNSEIDESDAIRLVNEAVKEGYDEICCTGGEPFLKRKVLYTLANICRDNNVMFGVITNAYWAKKRDKAFKLARELVKEGFTRVTISWDQSHGEWISSDTAQNAVDACIEAGLKVCLTGSFKKLNEKHEDYGIDVSDYLPYDNFALYNFPVAEAGLAAENNIKFEKNKSSLAEIDQDDPLRCIIAHKRELVIYAREGISQPCCSIYGGYKMSAMSVGDWRKMSVKQLKALHEGDPFNRLINIQGFRFVLKLIQERDIELYSKLPKIEACDTVCNLCSRLMTPIFGPRIREICADYVSEEIASELLHRFGEEIMAPMLEQLS